METSKLQRFLYPIGLLIAVSAALWQGFSFTRVFYYRDLLLYSYPMPQLAMNMLRHGYLPLWDPYTDFGSPLAAMPDLLLYYPGTWLRFALPYPFGFNFHIIVHFYLAALGSYFLARDLEMSRPASFVVGAAYALSGPMLSVGTMANMLTAASWLPLCLLAVRWTVRQPTALRIMLLGVAFGMQAMGGETIFSIATALLAIPLSGVKFTRMLRALVPAAAFGMALIGVQLLPALELLRASVRHSTHFTFLEAAFFSLHPLNLIECLIPNVLFFDSSDAFRCMLYGKDQPYLSSIYLGLLPLGLAVLALGFSRRREVSLTAACGAGLLAITAGSHAAFYTIIYDLIPFISSSRYPMKTIVVVGFCVALLAGWGLDAVVEHGRDPRPFHWGWMKWVLAVAAGLSVQLFETSAVMRAWTVRKLIEMFPGELAASQLLKLGALGAFLVLLVVLIRRRPVLLIGLTIFCLAADLAGSGDWINTAAPAEIMTKPSPLLPLVGNGSPDFRIDSDVPWIASGYPILEGWSPESLSALEAHLSMHIGDPLEGVRDSRVTHPNKLHPAAAMVVRNRLEQAKARHDYAALGEMNIRYFITATEKPFPGLREVGRVDTIRRRLIVWEIENWRPRVEVPGGTARVISETPTRVTVEADGGTLLLRETCDDGWRATVDGASTPITCTADRFRQVAVPAGRHTVEFLYRPWTFPAGLAISFAAVLAFLMTAWNAFRRRE